MDWNGVERIGRRGTERSGTDRRGRDRKGRRGWDRSVEDGIGAEGKG